MNFPSTIAPIVTASPIHVLGNAAMGGHMFGSAGTFFASIAWPTGNLAMYYPFRIPYAVTVTGIQILNGASVSGNVDVGIYSAEGTRIASSGSTAQAGASSIQTIALTSTILAPGQYYIALAFDNSTGTTAITALATFQFARAYGVLKQATAFPLPATAVFAACTTTTDRQIPMIGVQVSAVHAMTQSPILLPCATITPFCLDSIGGLLGAQNVSSPAQFASGTWPTANDAMLAPFSLAAPVTVKSLFAHTGSSAVGNIDLGIYDESLSKIGSTGSTAQASVSAIQVLTPTATRLGPGNYYLALAADSASSTFFLTNPAATEYFLRSIRKFAASFPLGTLGTEGGVTKLPMFGLGLRGVI